MNHLVKTPDSFFAALSNLKIQEVEAKLLSDPDCVAGYKIVPASSLPEVNHFVAAVPEKNVVGMYARELWRPAKAFIIGHEHRYDHLCVLTKGVLYVLSDGKITKRVAGDVWTGKAGMRKFTYVPEWCAEGATLITFHPTNTTDLELLEEELIVKSDAFKTFETELKMLKEAA